MRYVLLPPCLVMTGVHPQRREVPSSGEFKMNTTYQRDAVRTVVFVRSSDPSLAEHVYHSSVTTGAVPPFSSATCEAPPPPPPNTTTENPP